MSVKLTLAKSSFTFLLSIGKKNFALKLFSKLCDVEVVKTTDFARICELAYKNSPFTL